jgi:hypothetical protein
MAAISEDAAQRHYFYSDTDQIVTLRTPVAQRVYIIQKVEDPPVPASATVVR